MNEIMSELSALLGMVKDIAPEVWRIALQQVAVNATTTVLFAVVLAVCAVLCIYVTRCMFDPDNEDADAEVGASFAFAALCFVLATAAMAIHAYKLAANPEYHAIKILLELAS